MMILADKNKVCKESHEHIHIGTEQVPQPHELETVEVFYCITCNCTWKEA